MSEEKKELTFWDKFKPYWNIFYERVRRPMVFVAVCLIAAVMLFFLQKGKLSFDKTTNAPIVIVEPEYKAEYDKKPDAEKNLIRVQSSDTVVAELNPPDAYREIIGKSIKAVQYESFLNEDELINKLYEVVKKYKEGELKDLNDRAANNTKSINDHNEQKETARRELNKMADKKIAAEGNTDSPKPPEKTNDNSNLPTNTQAQQPPKADEDTRTVNISANAKKPDSAMLGAVFDRIRTKEGKDNPVLNNYLFTKTEVELNEYAKEQMTELESAQTKIKTDINNTDAKFENIYGIIFKNFKNKETVNKLFPKIKYDAFRQNVFDGKNGLSVVYWLLEITLKVILVFGLLYVILIPLKHIFFIALSLDEVTAQGKKAIEKAGTATLGLTMLSKAIIVTLTTIAIGSAALAGASLQTDAKDEAANLPPTAITKDGLPPNPLKKPPPPSDDAPNPKQIEIERLKASVDALKQQIDVLNGKFGDTSLTDMASNISDTKANTEKLKDVVGTREDAQEKDTIFKAVKDYKGLFDNNDTKVAKQLETFTKEFNYREPSSLASKVENISQTLSGDQSRNMDVFGKNTNYTDGKPQNLIQAVDAIWQTLGTSEYLQTPKTAAFLKPHQRFNLFQTLAIVDDKIGVPADPLQSNPNTTSKQTAPETLFGKVNYVSQSIGTDEYVNTPASIYSTLGAIKPKEYLKAGPGSIPVTPIPSLVAINQSIEKSAKNIENSTTDMSRYMFGGDGGGFFQYFKNVFASKRYVITDFAMTTLDAFYKDKPGNDLIKDIKAEIADEKSKLRNAILSEEDIAKALFPLKYKDKAAWEKADKSKWELWKKNKSDILRYFRIVL